jgi:hypothetical protein
LHLQEHPAEKEDSGSFGTLAVIQSGPEQWSMGEGLEDESEGLESWRGRELSGSHHGEFSWEGVSCLQTSSACQQEFVACAFQQVVLTFASGFPFLFGLVSEI